MLQIIEENRRRGDGDLGNAKQTQRNKDCCFLVTIDVPFTIKRIDGQRNKNKKQETTMSYNLYVSYMSLYNFVRAFILNFHI